MHAHQIVCTALRVVRNATNEIQRAWLPSEVGRVKYSRKNKPQAVATAVSMPRVAVTPMNTPSHTNAAMLTNGTIEHHQ